MKLDQVDRYYEVAAVCTVTAEVVANEQLHSFTRSARKLDRALEVVDSDYWSEFRRKTRRVAWDLLNAAVPFRDPVLEAGATARLLVARAESLRGSFTEDLTDTASDVAHQLAALSASSANPLGEVAAEVLSTGTESSSAVLVRDSRLIRATEQHLRRRGLCVRVLTTAELRTLSPIETLVVVGQARLYPSSVLVAPRAENVCIVRYGWLRDLDEVEPFIPAVTAMGVSRPVRSHRVLGSAVDDDGYLEPSVDWAAIGQHQHAQTSPSDHDTELGRARLFLLAGGYGSYVESDDGEVLVVDLEADEDRRVRRKGVRDLRPGDFVLLRKERGAGDFIEDVANQILGPDAVALRAAQVEWKEALRSKVRAKGVTAVRQDLRALGAKVQNVRYWINPSNIRTHSIEDFRVLMDYVGLGRDADLLWAKMGSINDAHYRAGRRVRTQLLERVAASDLAKLERDGWMDFELQAEAAGSLTAFRVEARSPEAVFVSRHLLRSPFPVERDLWLG